MTIAQQRKSGEWLRVDAQIDLARVEKNNRYLYHLTCTVAECHAFQPWLGMSGIDAACARSS